MKGVGCPVLIIHGNSEEDQEELQLLERSRRGMALLPEGSNLVIVEGAKHGIKEKYDEVVRYADQWLKPYLTI